MVGVIWGVSNVLLDKYVKFKSNDPATATTPDDQLDGELTDNLHNQSVVSDLSTESAQERRRKKKRSFGGIFNQLIKNKTFLLIYGLTQIGSIWYSIFIRYTNIGFGVMCAYGISLLVSYLLELGFGWTKLSKCKIYF